MPATTRTGRLNGLANKRVAGRAPASLGHNLAPGQSVSAHQHHRPPREGPISESLFGPLFCADQSALINVPTLSRAGAPNGQLDARLANGPAPLSRLIVYAAGRAGRQHLTAPRRAARARPFHLADCVQLAESGEQRPADMFRRWAGDLATNSTRSTGSREGSSRINQAELFFAGAMIKPNCWRRASSRPGQVSWSLCVLHPPDQVVVRQSCNKFTRFPRDSAAYGRVTVLSKRNNSTSTSNGSSNDAYNSA